jgi:hypothetical protein
MVICRNTIRATADCIDLHRAIERKTIETIRVVCRKDALEWGAGIHSDCPPRRDNGVALHRDSPLGDCGLISQAAGSACEDDRGVARVRVR